MGLKSVGLITTWHVRCGLASYSENLANALANLGVDVYIVKIPRFGAKIPEIFQRIINDMPANKVDILHCQHEYGIWQGLEGGFYGALKALGKPIVTTMHAVGIKSEIDRIISQVSNKVIVHNQFMAQKYSFPSVIIPHGTLPTKCPPPEQCKKALGFDPRMPIVGYLGFISEYKGLEVLIEAMAKVPKTALLIGGGWHTEIETTYINKLRQKSFDLLPNRVQWLGFVPDEKMSTAYGAMDMVVYPSRYSTESGALLTAISHGKAVIASNLAPFREKADILWTFKDADDLTKKIRKLLRNAEVRKNLEENAKRYAQENSWANVAKKHIELYESILADKLN